MSMDKKDNSLWVFLGIVAVVGLAAWGIKNSKENELLKSDLKRTKNDYLILLNEYLKQHNQTLPEPIKQYVIKLKEQYKGIDENVVKELDDVEGSINSGKDEQAFLGLSKIVENILKDRYVQECSSEIEKKKIPTYHKLLEFAKEHNWISEYSFMLCKEIKNVRNTLAHELAVKLDENTKTKIFFGSIGVIYELKGIPNE